MSKNNKHIKQINIYLWYMSVVIFMSMIGACSIYHFFSGQTSLSYLILILLTIFIPSVVFDKRYRRISDLFLILCVPYLLAIVIGSGEYIISFDFSKRIFGLILGGILLKMKDELKLFVLKRFLNIYTILLTLSMIEYFLILFSDKGILLGNVGKSTMNSEFQHYILNIIRIGGFRFQFICDEPGDIGTLNGLLLFIISRYQGFRKQFAVIIASGLLSLSFAFYVFFCIYLLKELLYLNIKHIVIIILSGIFFYSTFSEYVDFYIIDRYEGGNFDNRSTEEFNDEFEKFTNTSDIWFGKGIGAEMRFRQSHFTFSGSSGVKKEIYDTGLIGVLLLMIALSLPYIKMIGNNYSGILFLIVFWMSFYQRENVYSPEITLAFFSAPAIFQLSIIKSPPKKKNLYDKQSLHSK